MPVWGDDRERLNFEKRHRLAETFQAGMPKKMGYADRLGRPEIILLILFNVAFFGGLGYLILF